MSTLPSELEDIINDIKDAFENRLGCIVIKKIIAKKEGATLHIFSFFYYIDDLPETQIIISKENIYRLYPEDVADTFWNKLEKTIEEGISDAIDYIRREMEEKYRSEFPKAEIVPILDTERPHIIIHTDSDWYMAIIMEYTKYRKDDKQIELFSLCFDPLKWELKKIEEAVAY